MGEYTGKLLKRAGALLGSDEQLLFAVRAQPKGTSLGMGIGGAIGQAVAQRQQTKALAKADSGSAASSWPGGNTAVGLTNKRLMLFDYTAMGKPKDLVAEFPLDQVSSVELEKKKITANALKFAFADGSGVEVECGKLEKTGDFVEAFRGVKAGS